MTSTAVPTGTKAAPDTDRTAAAPVTVGSGAGPGAPTRAAGSPRRHQLDDWRPEDPVFWRTTGAPVARRNLIVSIASEHIGFSVWSLWSVMVLFLGPQYGIDPAGKFLLTAVPTALGSVLRLPYTLAVARFGGRNWTIVSALLLLLPAVPMAILIEPGVSYGTLMVLACLAGVGGGNFASSMANINLFYPQRLKGWALGLNAGGGNIGVAAVQLVGLAVLATAGAAYPRLVPAVYLPLIVLAALASARYMDNIRGARNSKGAIREAAREPHTWIMSLLYIGTFGSFIGFGFAFGQVLQVQFKEQFATPIDAAYLTFLGPLVGSLIRPVGGWLADRFGGSLVTLVNFAAMAAGAGLVYFASGEHSLPLYLIGFIGLFVFSGIGNGSTYKMIPAIFRARATLAVSAGQLDAVAAERRARRLSGALIGIAGAVGAFGGVLVNIAFRQSFLTYQSADAAYLAFIAWYAICLTVTWVVYRRPSKHRLAGV
ncbi:nitrate/nitrite transporter [Plantactinospora soyae]|uniref:NNP family nitrate/nitrite transporter-like MFS transporter n=1 Tax=Plantactinospora soyae TaxID=1544732 RepID=A0A927M414_9ACTN|nr:nitrate/nitrite transporter [Plantactinospora soyae]MBE1485093.1 NNP family nitrate/nitrite transporter-like MFS transporter [Plantactinospora soyae]